MKFVGPYIVEGMLKVDAAIAMLENLKKNTNFEQVAGIKIPDLHKVKVLGSGYYGVAFDIGGGKVLKLTKDKAERNAASLIAGKRLKGVYKIFGVYNWAKTDLVTFIVTEKVTMNESKARQVIRAVEDVTRAFVQVSSKTSVVVGSPSSSGWNSSKAEWTKFKKDVAEGKHSDYLGAKIKTIELAEGIIQGFMSLDKAGIFWADLHAGNVAFRGGKAVIIDMGHSKSGGGNVKIFEGQV